MLKALVIHTPLHLIPLVTEPPAPNKGKLNVKVFTNNGVISFYGWEFNTLKKLVNFLKLFKN